MTSEQNHSMLALLAAANDPQMPVDRLTRAAALAAQHLPEQEEFSKWAELELSGYSKEGPVPTYREIQASLFGRHPRGWRVPVRVDASAKYLLSVIVHQPIDEVLELSKNDSEKKIALWMEPVCVKSILQKMPNLIDVWRETTPSSFATIAHGVRRKIYQWAMTQQRSDLSLPPGSIEATLGLRSLCIEQKHDRPDQMLLTPFTINGNNANVNVVHGSPGASVTQTQSSEATEVISLLIAALGKAQKNSEGLATTDELNRLVEVTQELQELSKSSSPNPKWVSATLDGLQAFAKETATAVGAELAKPYVQAALVAAYQYFSRS